MRDAVCLRVVDVDETSVGQVANTWGKVMKKPRIVMIVFHKALCKALTDLLCDACECVGRSQNEGDTLGLVRSLHPDIVLMDLASPRGLAIQSIFMIKKEMPKVKVIALSDLDLELYRKMSLKMGASGYVLKEDISSDLIPEIRRVWADEAPEVFSIKVNRVLDK